jgi:hypothetical protein
MDEEIKYSFKPTGQLAVSNFKPNHNISFHNNGQEIGKLDFNGPALVFTGDAEESAKVFIDWVARFFHGRLEEERKAEREACAKVCNQFIEAPQKVLTVAELREIDPYKVRTRATAARIIQDAIRARGNT